MARRFETLRPSATTLLSISRSTAPALAVAALMASAVGCAQQSATEEESWRVAEVWGPDAVREASSFAVGATVRVDDDGLVLSLRGAQVKLAGNVSREANGRTSVELLDPNAARQVRWEAVDQHRALLIWHGDHGDTAMELERVTR